MTSTLIVYGLCALSIVLMLARPWGTKEVWWPCGGAVLLVAFRLLSPHDAWTAIAKGADVYFFLTGMMLLSELARYHGVFDWMASSVVRAAHGSRTRLFAMLYAAGTMVTIFMSNDATAVVLTPAVLAAVKKSKAEPLPFLLTCAFIANAASFVLPISNPANLVVFYAHMPALGAWLKMFGLPSVLAIAATFVLLRWTSRKDLEGGMEDCEATELKPAGRWMLWGIALVAAVLLVCSAFDVNLGLPTFCAAALIAVAISIKQRAGQGHNGPLEILGKISWSVLPLVAGLFVLVEAVEKRGALQITGGWLQAMEHWPRAWASLGAGFGVGIAANLLNNLPLGLIAGASVHAAHSSKLITNAVLIGTDLGPNLSVTGSLATILWLIALRREGMNVSFGKFLKVGLLVMPPALALACIALLVGGQ
ncbi:MAG: arsenic transporter [Acidobacteriaceae bacterium]